MSYGHTKPLRFCARFEFNFLKSIISTIGNIHAIRMTSYIKK